MGAEKTSTTIEVLRRANSSETSLVRLAAWSGRSEHTAASSVPRRIKASEPREGAGSRRRLLEFNRYRRLDYE